MSLDAIKIERRLADWLMRRGAFVDDANGVNGPATFMPAAEDPSYSRGRLPVVDIKIAELAEAIERGEFT